MYAAVATAFSPVPATTSSARAGQEDTAGSSADGSEDGDDEGSSSFGAGP